MQEQNPRLRAAVMAAVEQQLENGDPPETRETLERLKREGFSDEDARALLAEAVTVEIFHVLMERKPFNRERFVRNLAALPAQPQE